MADATKTVAIIFEGQDKTSGVIDDLAKSITAVGDAAGGAAKPVEDTTTAIDGAAKSATIASEATKGIADGLRKLAEDAGAPKPVLEALDSLFLRLGAPGAGSVVVAGAAIAAFGIVAGQVGSQARDFKIALENVSGGAIDSEKALRDVVAIVQRIETDLGAAIDQYQGFLIKLQGTGFSTDVATKAFEGILKAVEGIGGTGEEAQKALDAFIKIARDGSISTGDLGAAIGQIPGGLRILSEALSVPVEDLRALAKSGDLGRDAIERFAEALNSQQYQDISPVSNAFDDLINTLKRFAIDIGSDGAIGGGLWLLEKTIRSITVAVTTGVETLKFFGATLANVAFTISSGDFAGFWDRQKEAADESNKSIQGALDKLTGVNDALKDTSGTDAATSAYADMAAKLKAAGDEAAGAAGKTEKAGDANAAAAKAALALAKEETAKEKALAASAAAAQKAEEAAQKYALEMEKIASNERIKFIEAKVTLDVAQLEEGTKRVIAAFDSINTTIDSTADVIGNIFSLFGDLDKLDSSARNALFEQLDKENKRRDDALKLQKELTEAQIEVLKAQARSLEQGDAIIKVDGSGLQPHLEAFMWEILKAIQVRVNNDGLELLLGIP
ncbi:MAG: hypothetical protein RLZZ524_654 [Pseudomonadota bacterium]